MKFTVSVFVVFSMCLAMVIARSPTKDAVEENGEGLIDIRSDRHLQHNGEGLIDIRSDHHLQHNGEGLIDIRSDHHLQHNGEGLIDIRSDHHLDEHEHNYGEGLIDIRSKRQVGIDEEPTIDGTDDLLKPAQDISRPRERRSSEHKADRQIILTSVQDLVDLDG